MHWLLNSDLNWIAVPATEILDELVDELLRLDELDDFIEELESELELILDEIVEEALEDDFIELLDEVWLTTSADELDELILLLDELELVASEEIETWLELDNELELLVAIALLLKLSLVDAELVVAVFPGIGVVDVDGLEPPPPPPHACNNVINAAESSQWDRAIICPY